MNEGEPGWRPGPGTIGQALSRMFYCMESVQSFPVEGIRAQLDASGWNLIEPNFVEKDRMQIECSTYLL